MEPTSLHCSLCDLYFTHNDQLKQHLEGKRHKKLESIRTEREQKAWRSLFVSGIKKDTDVKQLEQHFSQFGTISKLVPDSDKNAYAIIEYESESSVQKALAVQSHVVNGKLLKVKQREIKDFVSRVGVNNEKKREALEKLKEEALAVNKILVNCDSFEDQVNKLIDHLKVKPEQLKQRELIGSELERIFKQFWNEKDFHVSMFGSSQLDLAVEGSDMDLTLLFKEYLVANQHKQVRMPKIVVKNLSKSGNSSNNSDSNMAVEEGAVESEIHEDSGHNDSDSSLKESITKFFNDKAYGEFLNFDVEHQIKIAARIIQRFNSDVQSLKTITNTRCPVVRFFHEQANINCDLSLNNFLAVENTKLVSLYMNLMPQLKRMIYVLRYWFKQKNLHGANKFNSYTIIWMIVFYMQQTGVAFLPTVEELAKLTEKKLQIHGWDCAFETDLEKIKSNMPANWADKSQQKKFNADSMNDLLKGFFEFYSKFRFTDPAMYPVICVRTGQLVYVNKTNPVDSRLAKFSDHVNIQDPFDLSHNLSGNISAGVLSRFLAECKASSDLLTYSTSPRKSNTKAWGLSLLMTKKGLPASSHVTTKTTDTIEVNASDPNLVKFIVSLMSDCLRFEPLNSAIKRKKPAVRALHQICDQVDSLGLGCCSPKRQRVDEEENYVATMIEAEEDEEINNNNEKLVDSVYFSTGKCNTWQGRRPIRRELVKSEAKLSELELEKLISQKLITSQQEAKTEEQPINFGVKFFCCENAPNKLKIKFESMTTGGEEESEGGDDMSRFNTLVHFLDIYISNSLKAFDQWRSISSH